MRESGTVSRFRCIQERDFQDWLASPEIGLLVRGPQDLDNLEIAFKKGVRRTELTEKFFSLLMHSAGYIVPSDTIARHLYGRAETGDIIEAERVCNKAKKKMENPQLLYAARGLGNGLGITDFRLPFNLTRVVYLLWENHPEPVLTGELARKIGGQDDEANRKLVNSSVWKLNNLHFRPELPFKVVHFYAGARVGLYGFNTAARAA